MRIMATSDLHGSFEGLDPDGADVVVIAGDIAPLRGRGPWHINDQRKWINKQFHEWTSSYPDIHFVVIPGNHDFFPIAHLLFKEKKMDWRYEFSPTSTSCAIQERRLTASSSMERHGFPSFPTHGHSKRNTTYSPNASRQFPLGLTC